MQRHGVTPHDEYHSTRTFTLRRKMTCLCPSINIALSHEPLIRLYMPFGSRAVLRYKFSLIRETSRTEARRNISRQNKNCRQSLQSHWPQKRRKNHQQPAAGRLRNQDGTRIEMSRPSWTQISPIATDPYNQPAMHTLKFHSTLP